MQALKKAERAKQGSASEDDGGKPSEAFDAILALTPDAAQAPARAEPQLNLDPLAGLSLEPMAPATSLTPRPTPDPLPAASDHQPAGLTLDLAPDPAAAAPLHAPTPTPAPAPTAAKPAAKAQPRAEHVEKQDKPDKPEKAGKPRGAARARAAAEAVEPAGIDPARLRLIGLVAALLLIVAGFGYYYWQAMVAPGAGARLPPVPMPPPGATGATPAQLVRAAPDGQGAAADAADPLLAQPAKRDAARDDLERRLAQTEQQLAATQQAIQAQQNTPQPERLPPLAAPDNSEIKVARAVQASPLAPALNGAYQSLNNGDLSAAQQQYEAALRQDPNSRDALLGLAALAARAGQSQSAAGHYLRLLELDPNDTAAVAGLVGLRQGDPGQNELRLKAILAANPDAAPAQFALGNLYAQQGRWSEAQQAYFRAFSAAPDNPDYAYNLAIGLDRLNQGKLALGYYQRALALAQSHAAAFDRGALRTRMHELTAGAR
ncbi:tetratricopeptide repeat protein [Duganella sp. HSC-15S17]|nr:tetratricopeptide repeat protein [Duganella violaceicalia]